MPLQVLDTAAALANRRNESYWGLTAPDAEGRVWPSVTPSFSFGKSATVFTMGSCFARNVEDHLARIGCRVPMLDWQVPAEEWDGRPASMLNKFTPPNFRDTLQWVAGIYDRDGKVTAADCADYALEYDKDRFLDVGTASQVPVTMARLIERRQQIYDVFAYAFKADVVVLTPGYIEAWRDTVTGRYLAGVFKAKKALRMPGRFVWEQRSYEESVQDLLAAIDTIRARNSGSKFLVTTSPVPLGTTFSAHDVRVANMLSKSILRAACGALPLLREGVDYFPSYESAMLSDPRQVWKEDRVHIRSRFIRGIVAHLEAAYVEGAAPLRGPPARSRSVAGRLLDWLRPQPVLGR